MRLPLKSYAPIGQRHSVPEFVYLPEFSTRLNPYMPWNIDATTPARGVMEGKTVAVFPGNTQVFMSSSMRHGSVLNEALSIVAWVAWNSLPPNNNDVMPFLHSNAYSAHCLRKDGSGNIGISVTGGTSTHYQVNWTPTLGRLYCLGITRMKASPYTTTLYVDGTLIGTVGSAFGWFENTWNVGGAIAAWTGGSWKYHDGVIGKIVAYPFELSAAEVKRLSVWEALPSLSGARPQMSLSARTKSALGLASPRFGVVGA